MRDDSFEIRPETTVGTLLARWPELRQVFLRRGMSCPGCVMSRFDPLDYVARVYDLRPERWVAELRREVRTPSRNPPARAVSRSRGRRVIP